MHDNSMKRTRDSTSVFTAPPKRNEDLLTVDSDRHSAAGTSVDFRVRVSDFNNSLNNLDVSAYQDWEVGVESVSAPNNGEAFHSIDENNQSMFFCLEFYNEWCWRARLLLSSVLPTTRALLRPEPSS